MCIVEYSPPLSCCLLLLFFLNIILSVNTNSISNACSTTCRRGNRGHNEFANVLRKVGKVLENLRCCENKVKYVPCPLSHKDVYCHANNLLFSILYCSLDLPPYVFSSCSRTVIVVRVHEGLAGPTGWSVLCMSLIKHSFLIGAPPPPHPSVFLSSLSRPCNAQWAN